ncbi:604_t:CDS:10 [Funneliformis geosporum]|nr:604_t:CDS:10 [Funneliformis geosporum]
MVVEIAAIPYLNDKELTARLANLRAESGLSARRKAKKTISKKKTLQKSECDKAVENGQVADKVELLKQTKKSVEEKLNSRQKNHEITENLKKKAVEEIKDIKSSDFYSEEIFSLEKAGTKINSIKAEPIKKINAKNKEADNLVIKQIITGGIKALPTGFQKGNFFNELLNLQGIIQTVKETNNKEANIIIVSDTGINDLIKNLSDFKEKNKTLKARRELEKAIKATPKAETSGLIEGLVGRSGEIKLAAITEVLQKLQNLIPQVSYWNAAVLTDNNSLTEPELSEEEKVAIKGATNKENLKDIQKGIGAKQVYSTSKGYEEAENYLSKIENEEQKNNWEIVAGSKVEKAQKIWNQYHREDIHRVSEILKEISITNNLTELRRIDLDNLGYDEEFVPANYGHNKIKELLKATELNDDYCRAWLALPHLARDGVSERKMADNELNNIKIYDFHQVKKTILNLVKELLNDINGKTESSQLSPYAREGDINSLPAETSPNKTDLPAGWRRDEVKNFLENKRKKLDKTEFVAKFRELYFLATSFSDGQIYNQFRAIITNPTTSEQVKQAGETNKFVYYAKIEEQEFNPNVITRNEAIKKVWVEKFRNSATSLARRTPPNEEGILKYKKGDISADQARQRFSHAGFQDENLNALKINKLHLQKVYLLLKEIGRANLEDIPSLRERINNSYVWYYIDESKIPFSRSKANTLCILNTKQVQLEAQAENNLAVGRVKDYWNSLNLLGTIETALEVKIKPEIAEIEVQLNKVPVVSSTSLKNSDYRSEMLTLVADDNQRQVRKAEIMAEISQIREGKLAEARAKITKAKEILENTVATQGDLERVIKELKILRNGGSDKIPTPLTPPSSPLTALEEMEKFGADAASLNPLQKEGRTKIVENWKKEENYERSKTCRYCPQEFHYDRNLEYLVAKIKVEAELKKHEETCEAKKQAIADLAYHEEHECGQESKKKIAIYFSPNQGGNEHAPLTYAEKIKEEELTLEQDNQGEVVYQEKGGSDNKKSAE